MRAGFRHVIRGIGQTDAAPGDVKLGPGPLLLGLALTLGLLLRLAPVLSSAFPLGDGGLFATMARDIREAHFAFPLHSSYNAGDVPFAYPPLGLYILAAIPGDPVATERWLPLVYSMLAIAAAYLLARELISERRAGLAALIFAAMPIAWTIEGGGVTRGLGLALLILATWRVAVLLRAPSARNVAAAGVVAGAALLAHPGVGPTGAASALVLLGVAPSWRRLVTLLAAACVAVLVVVPWLVVVLVRYGTDSSLVAAGLRHSIGETLLQLVTVGPSGLAPLDIVVSAALVGIVVLVHRRKWLLPLWVVVHLAVPAAAGRNAAIVWAMLAAVGVTTLAESLRLTGAQRLGAIVGLVALLFTSFAAGYQEYRPLPSAIRAVMVTAGQATPPGTRFVIVAEDFHLRGIARDWFPTLSSRVSLGTSMGLEWASSAKYQSALALDREIQAGHLPPEADALFTISRGSASWMFLR